MNKKGISPLIATVLIIGFTVALGAVIIVWGTGFVKDMQQTATQTEQKASTFASANVMLEDANQPDLDNVNFVLTNAGSSDIESFIVRVEGDKGIQSFTETGLEIADKKYYSLSLDSDKVGTVKNIEVLPQINIEGKVVTSNSATTTKLAEPQEDLVAAVAQCADGIDNDADTFIDLADAGCADAADDDESDDPTGPDFSEVVFWLPMEEGDGLNWVDTSVNGLTGVTVDMELNSGIQAPTYVAEGVVGGAYDFSNTEDQIEFPHNAVLEPSEFSFDVWVTQEGMSNFYGSDWGYDSVFYKSTGSGWDNGYGLYREFDTAPLIFWVSDYGGDDYVEDSSPLANWNTWTHVAGTFSNTEMKLYVNGNLIDTDSTVTVPYTASGSGNLWVGSGNPGYPWRGMIDEFRIWSKALTQEEVTELYNYRG